MQELDRIYRDNFTKVYRYILSMTGDTHLAEDIAQETFFKALQKLDDFRGECSLTTWLCRIARNQYLNHVGRQSRIREISKQNPPEANNGLSAEDELILKEQTSEILDALWKLEEPYKEVFSLREFCELPYKEIGKIFHKNDSWARVIYYRGKLKLKEELKNEY